MLEKNSLGFLDILTILSFVVGVYALEIALKNLDENRDQNDELKSILSERNLSLTGKKAELINRIILDIPESELSIPNYIPKYELTEIGKTELADNGYVPYMHNHHLFFLK